MNSKNTLLFLVTFALFSFGSLAQNGINYKALVKDANGNIVANSPIQVNFTIVTETDQTIVYEETHSESTDANGLIILNIGEGVPDSDDFSTIDWSIDDHYLNVKIDTGDGFADMGFTQFKTVPYALHAQNVSGLEAIDEGNGIGWRLKGQDPNNYGDIGDGAVDLSNGSSGSNTLGANGIFSTAMGSNTNAFGFASTAMGTNTNALGSRSTAMGDGSTALGDRSTAMGAGTEASRAGSVAMGAYNLINLEAILSLGNGTNAANRSNALTILNNGKHTINSNVTGLEIYPGSAFNNVGMYIGPSGSSGIQIESSGNNGISINDANASGIQIDSPGDNGIFIDSPGSGGIVLNNSATFGIQVFNTVATGIIVSGAGWDGIRVNSAGENGGYFIGTDSGVHAESSNVANPDIILGGQAGSAGANDDGIIASDPLYDGSDIFLRSNDAVVMQLDVDGDELGQFEVRNGSSSVVFVVNDTGNANLTGSLSQNSDRRLKKDITNLPYGLNEVIQLQPRAYNWKHRDEDHKSLGLIAQEVQPIIKEIVTAQDDAEKTLGISYIELIPVLINAIKEQQKLIETQNLKISNLSAELDDNKDLEMRVKQIERVLKTPKQ